MSDHEETNLNDIIDMSDIYIEDSVSQISDPASSSSTLTSVSRTRRSSQRLSTVWPHFNKETPEHFGKPVWRICGNVFEKTTGVSSLRRHLIKHQIQGSCRRWK